MGEFDPDIQDLANVEPIEVLGGALVEYEFPSEDDPTYRVRFYDACGYQTELPYTLMSVLEFYYRHERAVKITVEDAGPADPNREQRQRLIAEQRQHALDRLQADARVRARNSHRPQY